MSTPSSPSGIPPWASALTQFLGKERLNKYRTFVRGGDLGKALQLYRWNNLASAAFYEVLSYTEVVLRNAMDQALQSHYLAQGRTGDWWDDPAGLLEDRVLRDVDEARDRVKHTPVTHGRIVAETNFGFWRYLLAARYETTLWTPALRHAFPHLTPARRADIYLPVDRLHALRNRIAHHEPIHHYHLSARHEEAIFVLQAINPEVAMIVDKWSR